MNACVRVGIVGSGVAPRRDCRLARYRGLKPTATITPSLRDEECRVRWVRDFGMGFWNRSASAVLWSRSPEGAQCDSPGQRLGFKRANVHKPCKGDTTGGSSLCRPFRAGIILGSRYPGLCPRLSHHGLSSLGGGRRLPRACGGLDCEHRTSDIFAMNTGEHIEQTAMPRRTRRREETDFAYGEETL